MTPEEFSYLRGMLKERSGLDLGKEKRYLLESRLLPVAREKGFESLSALVAALRAPCGEALRTKVTEAMTINESFFFRDKAPFEQFTDIMVPAILSSRCESRKTVRVWCTAVSGGQEPYSLAMQIRESEDRLKGCRFDILATELSGEALEKARTGLYSQFEVQRGLPIQLLVKYFRQTGSLWEIDPAIRAMVRFRQFNLLDGFQALGVFDVIFCRNVLIYFDRETKQDILSRLAARLRPEGFLVLGAAETVFGVSDVFKPVPDARGLYALDSGRADAAAHGAGGPLPVRETPAGESDVRPA